MRQHEDENFNSFFQDDAKVERGCATSLFCVELKDLIPEKYMTEYSFFLGCI